MEVLRRCPLAIAQRLVHRAIALSTKTMSVAPLLMNNLDNSKQKTSNLLSPAPPPYSWSLLGKSEGPVPPPSSKISWSRLEPLMLCALTYIWCTPSDNCLLSTICSEMYLRTHSNSSSNSGPLLSKCLYVRPVLTFTDPSTLPAERQL